MFVAVTVHYNVIAAPARATARCRIRARRAPAGLHRSRPYVLAIPIAILAPLVALLFYVGIAVLYAVTNQSTQPAGLRS